MKKIKKVNWKKVFRKAFHTFWQSFFGGLIITDYTKEGIKIAVIATLLSALKTTIVEMLGDGNK